MIQSALDVSEKAGESKVKDTVAFLDEARQRYQFGLDADYVDRNEAELDNKFANASDLDKAQWDEIPLRSRRDNHRPVLQWNRIPTYVQQVANDGRQNKPAIKITQGDKGVKETAEFFQGRIRQVEYESSADIAYDTASDQQITSGRGNIRITTEWIPGTMRQRICIERIENQFSVVFDPAAKKYDRSDAEWAFVISRISKAEHIRLYGEESIVASLDFTSQDNEWPEWIGVGEKADMIQIAEYWVKEYKKRTLCALKDGTTAWKDSLSEADYMASVALDDRSKPIEREEQDATVRRYVINGAEILEEGAWLGTTIPIVPVWGREAVVQGIRRTYSLIRQAKDPQRGLNLLVSNLMEQLAEMPKTPWQAPLGSIAENHMPDYRDAGHVPKAILFYKQWDEQGRELSRPDRIIAEPPIQAIVVGIREHIDAIKAAMGIYDASLGARSNETTGVAIDQRRKSAEIVNFHFPDNQDRSRKRVGEILIELIPQLDKPGMRVPIRTEDGKTELVPIGQPYVHPKSGKEVVHVLTDGDYGIVVETGPSFASARKEENAHLQELVKAAPELITVIGDQVIRTSDFPGSDEIADRLENWIKAKNPGIIREDQEGQPQIPQEVQQKMMQMQQELAQTQAFAQSLHEKLETKQPELDNAKEIKRMELDFEREKLQVTSSTQLSVAEIKAGVDADIELLRHEIARIDQERGFQAEQQARESEQQHAQDMQEQQQAGALQQQQQAADLAPEPQEAQ